MAITSQASPLSLGIRPKAVVLILADDLGFNMIGYHNSTVLTPNIDALAAGGIKLEKFYVNPVCSPTRSALMTGRYTHRLGTQATVIRADVPFGVPLRETFVSQNMQDAGLTTALFGKWHLGFYQKSYLPLQRGFDEHIGYYQGAVHYYTHEGFNYHKGGKAGMDWHRGTNGSDSDCFADNGTYTAPLIVTEAKDFMKRMAQKNKPFFLYLPFHLVHGPNEVDESYRKRYPSVTNNATRTVLGMISALDDHVKMVIDGLKEAGLYKESFVIWFSDNGPQPGQTGKDFDGAWPLKGYKTQLWEGGCLVPSFFHSPLLPASLVGTSNHQLFHVTDILPTLVNLVGGNTSRNLALDGFDMMPAILAPHQEGVDKRTEVLYTLNGACGKGFVNPNSALRMGEMKLLVECFNLTTKAPWPVNSSIWLHNLTADPFEEHNLMEEPLTPEAALALKSLMGRLAEFAADPDQYPPTLFPEHANHTDCGGNCPVWNFQCPQCPLGGAFPSKDWPKNGTTAPDTFNPWCNDVICAPAVLITGQN